MPPCTPAGVNGRAHRPPQPPLPQPVGAVRGPRHRRGTGRAPGSDGRSAPGGQPAGPGRFPEAQEVGRSGPLGALEGYLGRGSQQETGLGEEAGALGGRRSQEAPKERQGARGLESEERVCTEGAGLEVGALRVAEGVRATARGAARRCSARFLRDARAARVPGRRRGRTVQQVRGRAELSSPRAHPGWHLARARALVRVPLHLIFGYGLKNYVWFFEIFMFTLVFQNWLVSEWRHHLTFPATASLRILASSCISKFFLLFLPSPPSQRCLLPVSLLSALSHAGPRLC